jgi:FlaA1/EpsC-like NDP-sugar epimerase
MTPDSLLRRLAVFAALLVFDTCAVVFSYCAALWLRFDGAVPALFILRAPLAICGALGLVVVVFSLFRLYRFTWPFASIDTLVPLGLANIVGLSLAMGVLWMSDSIAPPRSVLLLFIVCNTVLTGGIRVALRLMHSWSARALLRPFWGARRATHCLIIGTGDEAVTAVRLLHRRPSLNYRILGFLDHRTPPAVGYWIFGCRILGGLDALEDVARRHGVDEAIIALPEAAAPLLRRLTLECRRLGVTPRILPSLDESLRQERPLDLMPEVSVEDLLRRDPVRIDPALMTACLRDKTVLVTGAGGSIGSELCRQILRAEPRRLLLLGHGENSIHRIAGELAHKFPALADRLSQIVCDVRDATALDTLFAQERPEIVFHAAAHKHVPLMELNPREAVKNNVAGTRTVARLAGQYGAERFVLISTDKAVNPTSIMGATKWVCEETVRHLAGDYPATRFITTRFGNVLGSRGSVVPLFKEQLAHGGPITVTHPQVTRFFMTIPEAAQLVLTAMAVGESGQVLVLDMGAPVAIVDLAREMIRLAGLEEGVDVRIVYTGLRAGEKLHEELFGVQETRVATPHLGLHIAERPRYLAPAQLDAFIHDLLAAADHWDPDGVYDLLATELTSLQRQSEVEILR